MPQQQRGLSWKEGGHSPGMKKNHFQTVFSRDRDESSLSESGAASRFLSKSASEPQRTACGGASERQRKAFVFGERSPTSNASPGGDVNHAQLPGALFRVSFYTRNACREKRKRPAEGEIRHLLLACIAAGIKSRSRKLASPAVCRLRPRELRTQLQQAVRLHQKPTPKFNAIVSCTELTARLCL